MSSAENNEGSLTREFEIHNQYGIHARPAALFVKTASRFDSDIMVEKDGSSVSGKSIMGLMSLEAGRGALLVITISGDDSEEAMDHLEQLIVHRKFDED